MSQEVISVIVPIYNSEKYMDRCIQSLLQQTYKDLEILLVDDASTDKSAEICDRYAKEHHRIKVIHKPTNGGSCAGTRNVGLDHATGKYIGFVDPDDDFAHDIFEKLHGFLIQNECDVTICGRYEIYQKKPKKTIIYTEKNMVMEKNQAMHMLFDDILGSFVWDKLFKKELWDGIRFNPETIFADDLSVMHHVLDRAERIGSIAEPLYYFYHHDTSISNTYHPFKWVETYLFLKERLEFAEKKYSGMTDRLQVMTLNFARLSLDNYLINRDACDEPYMDEIIEQMVKGRDLIRRLPMSWHQKWMIRYYNISPKLYAKSIKFIHWVFYSFFPNNFRKNT